MSDELSELSITLSFPQERETFRTSGGSRPSGPPFAIPERSPPAIKLRAMNDEGYEYQQWGGRTSARHLRRGRLRCAPPCAATRVTRVAAGCKAERWGGTPGPRRGRRKEDGEEVSSVRCGKGGRRSVYTRAVCIRMMSIILIQRWYQTTCAERRRSSGEARLFLPSLRQRGVTGAG